MAAKTQFGGPDDCWPWTGAKTEKNYGHINVHGSVRPAPRVAYELTHGPIPDGLFVLHRCDNPPCVNPAHLFLGTNRDNVADMMAKGRDSFGGRPPHRLKNLTNI